MRPTVELDRLFPTQKGRKGERGAHRRTLPARRNRVGAPLSTQGDARRQLRLAAPSDAAPQRYEQLVRRLT